MADENGRDERGFHPRHASPYPVGAPVPAGEEPHHPGEVTRTYGGPAGAPPVLATTAGFCPACGTPLDVGSRFCPRCGRATQLGQAAQLPVAAAAIAPPAPPPGGYVPPGPPAQTEPSPGRRVPTWVWAAIGGFVVAAAAVAVVLSLFVFGGGDSTSGAGARTEPTSAPGGYIASIRRPVALLTRSATVTGNTLGSAATAADVARVHTVARQQLAAVSQSFTTLSALAVAPAVRADQQTLLRAVGEQRRYLTVLVRTTGLAPDAALAQLGGVRVAGRRTVSAYRAFLRREPQAGVGVITAAGLTQTDGLRAALGALQDQTAPPDIPQNVSPLQSDPGPAVVPDGLGGSDGFSSPAGTTSCSAVGETVTCSSAAGSVSVDQFGTAYTSGSAGSGYAALGYGRSWSNGNISCSISPDLGTTCTNGDGYGFQIRQQDIVSIP